MTEEHKEQTRRVMDTVRHIVELISPFLLLIILYFVKPIFDAVPVVARQQEVMAIQQQNIANNVSQINAKQERLDAQLIGVQTRVEVLADKTARIERKLGE